MTPARLSVKYFIIIPIFLWFGLCNYVVTLVLITHSEQTETASFIRSNTTNVRSVAPTVALSVWEFNQDRVRRTIVGLDDGTAFRFVAVKTDGVVFAAHGDAQLQAEAETLLTQQSAQPVFDGAYLVSDGMLLVQYPVWLEEKNRQVATIVAGYSLDTLAAQHAQISSRIRGIAVIGTGIVLLGIIGFAWLSNRWLSRVAVGITQVAEGELNSNVNLSSAISEFQDIDLALRQLRRDALQLIELRSKSRAAEQIRHMALHDALTGLGNRRLLEEVRSQIAATTEDTWLEILHIDLDGFKEVNDKSGHEAGDRILEVTSERLKDLTGESDQIFRIGGDEFVILRDRGAQDVQELEPSDLAATVVERLCAPCTIEDEVHTVGASIGVVTVRTRGLNFDKALGDADIAMYAAKADGKSRYVHFTPALRTASQEKRRLSAGLENAIAAVELRPYYQPKVDSKTFQLIGAEALVRWHHPDQGVLSPDKFLELAKERRILAQIDQLIFQRVCDDIADWRAQGLNVPKISVNLSANRLSDPNLIDELKSSHFEPGSISFELLETVYLDDVTDDILDRLDIIRSLGISIELDDFGSGHASMVSLLQIAPDRLKIDKRFIQDLKSTGQAARLVSQIVGIGKSLGIPATAEGVETREQALTLGKLGCDMLQGYYFGKPCPADKFRKEYLTHETDNLCVPGIADPGAFGNQRAS